MLVAVPKQADLMQLLMRDDDDWITEMDEDGDSELGPLITAKVAGIAIKHFLKRYPFSRIKNLHEQYLVPSNCEGVCVPKANAEIWHCLS